MRGVPNWSETSHWTFVFGGFRFAHQRTAASKSAQPLLFRAVGVSSQRKMPTRRAGVVNPTIVAPLSYPKSANLFESMASEATLAALAAGRPQANGIAVVVTVTVPVNPAAIGCVESVIVTCVWPA